VAGSTSKPNASINRLTFGGKDTKYALASANTMAMTSIGAAATLYSLPSLIGQGSDIFLQRIGRKIHVRRMRFSGVLLGAQVNGVADDPYNVVRVSLVVAEPAFAAAVTLYDPWDPRVQSGFRRCLFDQRIVIQAPAKDSTGYIAAAVPFEFDVPMDIILEYVATAAASPRVVTIFLSVVSDSTAIANPGFTSGSYLIMDYTDV
jgi:hypothetical protein